MEIAPAVSGESAVRTDHDSGRGEHLTAERKAARKRWANLIRHIDEVDPLVCPRCGGMMKIIAFITESRAIRAMLDSVRRSGTSSAAGSRHPPPPARPAADDACRERRAGEAGSVPAPGAAVPSNSAK